MTAEICAWSGGLSYLLCKDCPGKEEQLIATLAVSQCSVRGGVRLITGLSHCDSVAY